MRSPSYWEPSPRRWALRCALGVWLRWVRQDTKIWAHGFANTTREAITVYRDWRKAEEKPMPEPQIRSFQPSPHSTLPIRCNAETAARLGVSLRRDETCPICGEPAEVIGQSYIGGPLLHCPRCMAETVE